MLWDKLLFKSCRISQIVQQFLRKCLYVISSSYHLYHVLPVCLQYDLGLLQPPLDHFLQEQIEYRFILEHQNHTWITNLKDIIVYLASGNDKIIIKWKNIILIFSEKNQKVSFNEF